MENNPLTVEQVLRDYMFYLVELCTVTGVQIRGYLVDIKLPVTSEEVAFYFLESNKAKRYLAKYNPDWLMSLPFSFFKSITVIEDDDISQRLMYRRLDLYHKL